VRLNEEVARAGGGIVSNCTAPPGPPAEVDLLAECAVRALIAMIAEGVSLIEIKSGYGLVNANELKMLKVARR